MSVLFSHMMPMAVSILIKGTICLLLTAAVCFLLRRASAATRHLVWTVALASLLLLPMLALALPSWNVVWHTAAKVRPVPPSAPALAAEDLAQPPLPKTPVPASSRSQAVSVGDVSAAPFQATHRQAASQSPVSRPMVLFAVLFAVWPLGTLLIVSRLAFGLRQIGRVGASALVLDEQTLLLAHAARKQLGLRRHVRFLRAVEPNAVTVPVTWGAVNPVILLPAQSAHWSKECVHSALLHELAHVLRWDWTTQLMGSIVCALYWWHPLVWLAARQARAESERACDDLVIGTGLKATDYAQRLVEVVRSMPGSASFRTVAVAMAQPSEVEGRLRAVLAQGRSRKPLTRRLTLGAVCLCLLLALPLAALRPVARAAGDRPTAALPRVSRGILTFIYIKDVASEAHPGRLLKLEGAARTIGSADYQLVNVKTGQRFRAPETVQLELHKAKAQGNDKEANRLLREAKAFQRVLNNSSVIITDADLKSARAFISPQNSPSPPVPALDVVFTPEGTRKMALFNAVHLGEVMGMVVDGRLVSSPIIREGLGNEAIISPFPTLAEAQMLATRLNQTQGTERASLTDYSVSLPDSIQEKGIAATLAAGSKATLTNGVTVHLVGVKNDQTPVPAGVYGHSFTVQTAYDLAAQPTVEWAIGPNVRTPSRDAFLAHGGSDPLLYSATPSVTWAYEPDEHLEGSFHFVHEFRQGWGPSNLMTVTPLFTRASQKTVTLKYGVAAGPWTESVTCPKTSGKITIKTHSGDVLFTLVPNPHHLSAAQAARGQAVVMVSDHLQTPAPLTTVNPVQVAFRAGGNYDRCVLALDNAGHVIADLRGAVTTVLDSSPGEGSRVKAIQQSTIPNALLRRVASFRLLARPFQWAEFQDVPLQKRELPSQRGSRGTVKVTAHNPRHINVKAGQ